MSEKIIAIIPARGGSTRIKDKNIAMIGGLPLIAHTILHASSTPEVDATYVTTDSDAIADVSRAYGVSTIVRPTELANDVATSESALLHALDERNRNGLDDPELVVFLQCTSPVRRAQDISDALRVFRESEADSLFSCVETHGLFWREEENGPVPLNYDYRKRAREQDRRPQYLENGSIYITKTRLLRSSQNRLGGRIVAYPMDCWCAYQVDRPEEVALIDWILRRPEFQAPIALPDNIELLVFDFDGVMTDNAVWVDETGRESVRCSRSDGLGLDTLRSRNLPMLVLSTEANPVVARRCEKIRLPCLQGASDKASALAAYLEENRIDPSNVIYLGNDVNDLECMKMVGCPVAVADAYPEVISAARVVLSTRGGHGAVRELSEIIAKGFQSERAV